MRVDWGRALGQVERKKGGKAFPTVGDAFLGCVTGRCPIPLITLVGRRRFRFPDALSSCPQSLIAPLIPPSPPSPLFFVVVHLAGQAAAARRRRRPSTS